jgi:hypothetical protein
VVHAWNPRYQVDKDKRIMSSRPIRQKAAELCLKQLRPIGKGDQVLKKRLDQKELT